MPAGRPRVYLARAIEGISRTSIEGLALAVKKDLDENGLDLVDANSAYLEWRPSSPVQSNHDEPTQIVEFQLDLLRTCDALLIDMTIPNRNYVGCCSELVYAYSYGMPTAVYVGQTDNGTRKWLRYHATLVCQERAEAIAFLTACLTTQ